LAITYNVLNLQQSLSQNGTTVASYTWLADGTKCGVVDNNNNGYDYTGSLIYTRSGSVRTLESAAFGGGRFVNTNNTILPYYYITDHLGSTRVITDNNGSVVERNDYYPFGGKHANPSYAQLSVNKQKFNGKELQTTGNTGFLDYGARMYDDVIGRWGVVDPHSENYYSWSTYHYAANNPLIVIDPDGSDWYTSSDGSTTMWKKGNADIEGYKNIGANYTQNIDNHTTVTYTQTEVTSMTFTGAEESSWESQRTNGTNCYQASSEMLQNEGVETSGRGTEILVTGTAANGRAGDANANASTGFAVVDQALENGNPIMVGVDYKNGSPNVDGRTDHFIVVSSKTETLNHGAVTSTTYNFFDPRTSYQNYGTSSNNQLTISNNKMTGSYNHGGSNYNYTVTTVRRNK
jgi:RHS repeat-associated protein